MSLSGLKFYFLCLAFPLLLDGCVSDEWLMRKDGSAGSLEAATKRMEQHPQDTAARAQQLDAGYARLNQLLAAADEARKSGSFDAARQAYEEVLKLQANNQRALDGLGLIESQSRHQGIIAEAQLLFDAGNDEGARSKVRPVLIEDPMNREARTLMQAIEAKAYKDQITPHKLKFAGNKTVTLEFRDTSIVSIFEIISKTSKINFVLDPTIRPDLKATIFVKDASVEEVIDFILMMHQMGRKTLTDNSLLIFPQGRANLYEDLTLRTYYLNHADAKDVANYVRAMATPKELYVDDKLNMISLKVPFEQLEMVEKLIAETDVPNPEVVIDVEVLQVSKSRVTNIGVTYPNSLTLLGATGATGSATGAGLTLNSLTNINSNRVGISPTPVINLLRNDGDTTLLANPKIRVISREKARILIGDKIPIINTTVASGSNFASTSANYLDVGLKLEVEPRVMLNDNVSIRLNLEVSSVTSAATAQYPTVGTRNASTMLMLADNETQILAGLINDSESKNSAQVPGLSDLPLVGRLFGNHSRDKEQSEIVLLITPHVVRNLLRPEAANAEFYGGRGGRPGGPININPMAIFQQFGGLPPQQPAAAPAAAAPASAPAAATPMPGQPQPLGLPFGMH